MSHGPYITCCIHVFEYLLFKCHKAPTSLFKPSILNLMEEVEVDLFFSNDFGEFCFDPFPGGVIFYEKFLKNRSHSRWETHGMRLL